MLFIIYANTLFFVLLGWSALIIEYLLIYSLSSLSGIVEPKNVSDKQIVSMLFALINASIKITLTKWWAEIPLRFQWQKFSLHRTWTDFNITCCSNNSKWCKLKEYMARIRWIKSNSFRNFKRKNSLIIKKETVRTVH